MGHKLAEFDVWEKESQAIHPEIHSRRERISHGPDPPALSDFAETGIIAVYAKSERAGTSRSGP